MIKSIDTVSAVIDQQASSRKVRQRGAMVETTAGWRAITKGDRHARLQEASIIQSHYFCQLCGISIGPGYYETEMYLWLVPPEKRVYLAKLNCYVQHPEWVWLRVCGGCADHHSRTLPQWMRVLSPECWETTILIDEEGPVRPIDTHDPGKIQQVLRAIDAHLKRAPLLLMNKLISYLAPNTPQLHLFLRESLLPQQEKSRQRKIGEPHVRREGQNTIFPPGEDLFLPLVTVQTPFL